MKRILAVVAVAAAMQGCANRRCDMWTGVECRASGEAAVESGLRIYALGNAGVTGDDRKNSLALLAHVIASEKGAADRVLTVLGDNIYERGQLSGDAQIAEAHDFYGKLFGAIPWKTVVVVPGNHDHGAVFHGGFDAAAIKAQDKFFHDLRADVVYPPAADPRTEQPWTSVTVAGHETCLTLEATDSQGFRENLLALPAPKVETAWNLAIAHHPTRTAANHMGDRYSSDYATYAKSLANVDALIAANDNVLFADLGPQDATHPGPPNIVSGAFSLTKRLKSPELTSCGSEMAGFVRISVVGDALVADFFSTKTGAEASDKPYCTQRIVKPGAGEKCGAPAKTASR